MVEEVVEQEPSSTEELELELRLTLLLLYGELIQGYEKHLFVINGRPIFNEQLFLRDSEMAAAAAAAVAGAAPASSSSASASASAVLESERDSGGSGGYGYGYGYEDVGEMYGLDRVAGGGGGGGGGVRGNEHEQERCVFLASFSQTRAFYSFLESHRTPHMRVFHGVYGNIVLRERAAAAAAAAAEIDEDTAAAAAAVRASLRVQYMKTVRQGLAAGGGGGAAAGGISGGGTAGSAGLASLLLSLPQAQDQIPVFEVPEIDFEGDLATAVMMMGAEELPPPPATGDKGNGSSSGGAGAGGGNGGARSGYPEGRGWEDGRERERVVEKGWWL